MKSTSPRAVPRTASRPASDATSAGVRAALPAAPPFGAAWAALACAVVTATLCYPAFTGAFLVSPISDQYIGGYAVREFGTAILRQTGHFPLWNPYLFGGMPYVGAMNGDIFYPPSLLLRLLLRPDVFVTWAFIIHIFLAGWLTYLFLRVAGVGFAGALLGGLAYMMGGPIASYVGPGHDGKLYVSALLPLGLLLLARGVRDGRGWAWPALALTVGLAILSPHPQLLQYMLLGLGAYALYLAFWAEPAARPPRPLGLRRLALALGAVALGLLMGAIQFLPVAQYVAWSPRAGGAGHGFEWAISYSMPIEELFNTYLPQFSGLFDNYWGRNFIHFHSEYLGAVVLVLAGCAFIGKRMDRRRWITFWSIVAAVTILWSLGGYTPFYRLIYALVPGTPYFRAPATMFFLTAFAVGVLVAEGTENVLRGAISVRYVVVWIAAAVAVALAAVGGVITTVSAGLAVPEMADRVAANAPFVTTGALRSLAFVVLAGAVLLALRRARLAPRAAAAVLGLLVVADLWSIERLYWRFSAPASVIYASDSAIAYLQRQPEPGRVIPIALGEGAAARDPELFGDALMIHRVRQAIGYHGNELRRYDVLAGHDDNYRPILTSPQIWRLLNVRYLLTNVGTLQFPGLQQVVGPVRDAAGSTVYLYRLPGDNPAAWVTPVSVKAPDDQALATVTDQRFDPRVAAVYDTAAPVTGARVETLPAPLTIGVTVTRLEPGHLEYRLAQPAPAGGGASLIASENYYPGWTATVDGRPAPVGRADYALIGVPLPAGATRVSLEFHSRVYEIARTITFVAGACALLWWAAAVGFERRAHG